MLSEKEIRRALARWYAAWNAHDLVGVMELFHEQRARRPSTRPGIPGSKITAGSASLRRTPSLMRAVKKFFSSGRWTGLQARKDTGESPSEGAAST